jgi:hypothetical protein
MLFKKISVHFFLEVIFIKKNEKFVNLKTELHNLKDH